MPTLDHNAGYVVAAFAITWIVLGGYLLYVRSRLGGLRRRLVSSGRDGRAAAEPLTPPAAEPLTQPGR